MKKLTPILLMIFLFSTTLNAQDNYSNLWEKVQKFEADDLPKSALKIVDEIYTKAETAQNSSQIVKTLFYKSKFALILEENAQLKVVNQFKEHIAESTFPTKNVLQNVLANLHWQYFNQNRWKFYQRTKTSVKVDKNDFRTWDLNTLFTEINTHYKVSLEEKILLQKIDLYQFADILQVVKGSKELRPTLYDFLAHNALDFYRTNETNITKPAHQFIIDNNKLLSEVTVFSTLNLTTKDKFSLQFNALKIYQDLIGFHVADKNLKALVDVDLQRLQFVRQYATFKGKEALYLKTLQTSKEHYKSDEVSGLYVYETAQVYHQQANSYNAETNKEHRFKNKEAIAICDEVIKTFPKSKGAKKCQYLKTQIERKNFQITAEKYVPINTNSRLLINYKNVNKLYFLAYKINRNQLKKLQKLYKDEEKLAFIEKLQKEYSWNASLRNEHDYLQHTTEVIVPKMQQNNYLIVASESEDLTTKTIYGTTNLQVTNLALVENQINGFYTYQVVDRNNGKPINNAKVNLKNYNTGRYNYPINKNFKTDKNGFFTYKSQSRHNQVVITVNNTDDTATFGNYYLYQHRDNTNQEDNDKIEIKAFIFTDRSIYRPGQTVYFKAIVLKRQENKSEVFTNEYVKVTLNDVNDQEVKFLELKLNEFGAVSGEFILPNNGLTGSFSIQIDESPEHNSNFYDHAYYNFQNAHHQISVEEYKRPKFKTEFKPVTETFKLNDSITVNGFAKSFAGTNITDAKVVYRVHRKVQYPNWWYWRRLSFSSEAQEITHGETVTDSSGNFLIDFLAQPDESVLKENQPIFIYEITADVTDVNGETRSATLTVKVGYHLLVAKIEMPQQIDSQEKNNLITITTENLNGEFSPAKGTLKIYKLQSPKTPLRSSPWSAPDYQDISENEFRKLFPHDAYTNNEGDEKEWKKGLLVFSSNFNTDKSKEIVLKRIKKWLSGNYIAVVETQDRFGKDIKDEARFTIFNSKKKEVIDQKLFNISTDKSSYKVGETIELQLASASKDITVVVQIERKHKIEKTLLIHLSNEMKTVKIPVKKEDNDGFSILYHFVNYNHFESGNQLISVTENKETISIETNTFRNKLQPGSKQTWSFTIKNDKNDYVASEVLASMYDASLDEFKPHSWQFNPIAKSNYYSYNRSSANHSFGNTYFNIRNQNNHYNSSPHKGYDQFNWFGFSFGRNRNIMLRGMAKLKTPEPQMIGIVVDEIELKESILMSTESDNGNSLDEVVITEQNKNQEKISFDGIQIRKNFKETAFFFPHLTTDKKGNVSFSFTTPEALTRWKLQLIAHTKNLQTATKTLTTVTQKELMVVPNAPRFLREGDKITLSAKISNLSTKNLQGVAQLQLTDAVTGKEININLGNLITNKNFTVDKKGNTNVSWSLTIPKTIQAVQYKIVAKAGNFSDGEQNALPVLSNRVLVTETIPMWVRSNQTKTFTLDKLKNLTSSTLKNHKLTLEVTSNPAWYAVQALPYLMEYPYDCAEQTFSKYYANTLASHIANSNPKIQEVFNSWKSSEALTSNLEKNQELKSLIIQEMPWLRDAQSETEQKKRIALLFDLSKMKNEQQKTIKKLQDIQMNNGGFPWFKGARYPNTFITNHIVSGFGHLQKLGVSKFDNATQQMLKKAVQFLDDQALKQYQKLVERADRIKAEKGVKKHDEFLKKNNLNYFILQYLYTRSFYINTSLNDKITDAVLYYKQQSKTYWKDYSLYAKGQIALIQYRDGNKSVSNNILASLKENSIISEELGMYWKANQPSWYWYQSPIETQALLIEAFSEIENDTKTIDNLKIWLLKNKQVNRWKTTKATTEAVYALLLQESDWVSITDMVNISLGNIKVEPNKMPEVKIEAGTGYFKTSWNSQDITPNMAEVTISKKGKGIAWGGLYWQYFEDLDKITSAKTPLQLNKKLFLKINSDTGKELKEITKDTQLNLGDLITVRIELRSDRDMEFIHMKDMRASGVEPVNVLSQYKWQDGLGYYESTKDAATNFFFDRLPKGIYVFEYDVRVNNTGDFSNGITTVQSMYAPEFSSHSEGVRIKVQ